MNEKVRFVVQSASIANTARRTKRRWMKGRHRRVVMSNNLCPLKRSNPLGVSQALALMMGHLALIPSQKRFCEKQVKTA